MSLQIKSIKLNNLLFCRSKKTEGISKTAHEYLLAMRDKFRKGPMEGKNIKIIKKLTDWGCYSF